MKEKKRQLAKLQMQGERRREENRTLDHTLMEKQVSVLERQAAEKLAGEAGIFGAYGHTHLSVSTCGTIG